jgi:internalin A
MRVCLALALLIVTGCSKKEPAAPIAITPEPAPAKAETPARGPETVAARWQNLAPQGLMFQLQLPAEVQFKPLAQGVQLAWPDGVTADIQFDRQPRNDNWLLLPAMPGATWAPRRVGSPIVQESPRTDAAQAVWILQPFSERYRVMLKNLKSDAQAQAVRTVLESAYVDAAQQTVEETQIAALEALQSDRSGPWQLLMLVNPTGTEPFARQAWPIVLAITRKPALADYETLRKLPSVAEIYFADHRLGDTELTAMPRLPRVQRLVCNHSALTDAGLSQLMKFPALAELQIDHTRLTGQGFPALQACKNLTRLSANGCQLRSSFLDALTRLPLEALSLQNNDLADSAVSYLAQIPTLQSLQLSGNKIEGKTLPALEKHPALQHLSLGYNPLVPGVLKPLQSCPALVSMTLDGVPLRSEDLSLFPPTMNVLLARGCGLTDAHAQALDANRRWQQIAVAGNLLSAKGQKIMDARLQKPSGVETPRTVFTVPAMLPGADPAAFLKQYKASVKHRENDPAKPIVAISLPGDAKPGFDLVMLRELPELEALDIRHCEVESECLAALPFLKALKHLVLGPLHNFADPKPLTQCPGLTHLTLADVSDPAIYPAMAGMPQLTHLEILPVQGPGTLDAMVAHPLPAGKLRALHLHVAPYTAVTLERLLAGQPKLEELTLDLRGVQRRVLTQLASLPELKKLTLLNVAEVREEDWKPLGLLPELRELTLEAEDAKDGHLVFLGSLSRLERLTLRLPRVSAKGLLRLKDMANLQSLVLKGLYFDDSVMPLLAGLKDLEELTLADTSVTDAGLIHLNGCEELRRLYLHRTLVQGKGLEALRGLKRLRLLGLRNVPWGDGAAEAVRALNALVELDLRGNILKPAELETILGLPELSTLGLPLKPDRMSYFEADVTLKKPLKFLSND